MTMWNNLLVFLCVAGLAAGKLLKVDHFNFRPMTARTDEDFQLSASEIQSVVTQIQRDLPAAIDEATNDFDVAESNRNSQKMPDDIPARQQNVCPFAPQQRSMSTSQMRANKFNWPKDRSTEMGAAAMISERAMEKVMTKNNLNRNHMVRALESLDARQTPVGRFCVNRDQRPCDAGAKYRELDGWCNNLRLPFWGAALTPHIRVTPVRYDDGVSSPRTLSVVRSNQGRTLLPNARDISTAMNKNEDRPHPTVTLLTTHFGQFFDHDFVNTPINLVKTNGNAAPPQCCNVAANCQDAACFPISIADNDRFYGPFGVKCMEFVRSLPAPRPDCTMGPREQMNQNSHFIDLSQVYGNSAEENKPVRAFERGGLKINQSPLAIEFRMMLMPPERDSLDCQKLDESRTCFKSGDSRVNIQTALTAIHTIFLREHNRISDFLWHSCPNVPDEILFQEARKIMIGQWQAIIYSEFVPVLVGDRIATDERNGVKPVANGFFTGYNENVNPGTWVEMSTAAYRLHTLIQNWLPMKRTFNESFKPFHEFFFTPYYMYEPGALDNLVEGLAHENSQSFDNQFTGEMTEHLFQAADEPFGLDILALNIQRGRDHGLATYNDVREFCGLPRARNFKDLEDVMTPRAITSLARIYNHVDDIDFYTGGVSENPVNRGDGLVGPTFACIQTGQFRDWRLGDRFWYENPGQFTPDQLNEIRKASLAGIICANTNIKQIQPRVFLDAADNINPRVSCGNIPQMDMSRFLSTIRCQ